MNRTDAARMPHGHRDCDEEIKKKTVLTVGSRERVIPSSGVTAKCVIPQAGSRPQCTSHSICCQNRVGVLGGGRSWLLVCIFGTPLMTTPPDHDMTCDNGVTSPYSLSLFSQHTRAPRSNHKYGQAHRCEGEGPYVASCGTAPAVRAFQTAPMLLRPEF